MAEAIKVVVRCRPLNSREIARGAKSLIQMKGNQTILQAPEGLPGKDKDPKSFTFDKSYWSAGSKDDPDYASQQTLYSDLGVDLLNHSFEGFNVCLFAYGQTGSGKSYSMMGYGEDRGIIPLTCEALFERITSSTSSTLSYTVEVSFMEIYNEKVRDLLNPKNKSNLKVREHPSLGPYVEDLSKLAVLNFAQVENLMDEGNKARTVAATKMNDTSSRSHSIFTLMLTQRRKDDMTGMEGEKVSRISLVDLAGSERANSTGATGQRLKEGAQINRSLTTLGSVISALAQQSSAPAKGKKKDDFVPYRDSTLTWLLKDSLGGNSMTAMIAAVGPADYEETLSTLRYADAAKKIKNRAVVNEDPNAKLIRELKEELLTLRSRLGGADQESIYDASIPPEKQVVQYKTKTGEIRTVTKADLEDQLDQSEKLLAQADKSWEEKLQQTKQIQIEREAALESLGIKLEKNMVGVHAPKKMPHLVNLNEDPLMSECLIYQIKAGRTIVGNLDSTTADIKLSGEGIQDEHCFFESQPDNTVLLHARPEAMCMVNGQRIAAGKPKTLKSGYRIIIGEWHVFRFNHPLEAAAARQRVRSSMGTSEITRSPHLSGEASFSGNNSPALRPDSPISAASGADAADWQFARREAVVARLNGTDVNLDNLADADLTSLYHDILKVKGQRRGTSMGRPESRMSSYLGSVYDDEDDENASSVFTRPFSGDTWGTENSSIDSGLALLAPALQQVDEQLREARESMEQQLEEQRDEYESKLQTMAASSAAAEEIKAERAQMETKLKIVQEEMQQMLTQQKQKYEAKLKAKKKGRLAEEPLTPEEARLARVYAARWSGHSNIKMAEDVFSLAATLKEANIIAAELHKDVVYQFTLIESSSFPSSAHNSIHGLEEGDNATESGPLARKPTIAIKVLDSANNTIYLWSTSRLRHQLELMRTLYKYIDKPYSQHMNFTNPFYNDPPPRLCFIGRAQISLRPLLCNSASSHVAAPILSPLLGFQQIGTCDISVKALGLFSNPVIPANLQLLQDGSLLTLEVKVSNICGLSSEDFEKAHCQFRLADVANQSSASTEAFASDVFPIGVTNDFSFMKTVAVQMDQPAQHNLITNCLPIDFHAQCKPTFAEKVRKHDRGRLSLPAEVSDPAHVPAGRRPEAEMDFNQSHDISVSLAICEIDASGEYQPVPVYSTAVADPGAFFLRQGLQRLLILTLRQSGTAWPWTKIEAVALKDSRLLDCRGLVHAAPNGRDVGLKPSRQEDPVTEANGTTTLRFYANWDSSNHESAFLNKPTVPETRALLRLAFSVNVAGFETTPFEMDISCTINDRNSKPPLKLFSYFQSTRNLETCTALFAVDTTPPPTKTSADLWRKDTSKAYVRGQEALNDWRPASTEIISQYQEARKRERQKLDVAVTKSILATCKQDAILPAVLAASQKEEVVAKAVSLWQKQSQPEPSVSLRREPSLSMVGLARKNGRAKQNAVSRLVPKSTLFNKKGYVQLLQDVSGNDWQKSYFVLRRPYLFTYTSQSERLETGVINVSAVKVTTSPELEEMVSRPNVFAIYTASNCFVCQAETAAARQQWMVALDPSL